MRKKTLSAIAAVYSVICLTYGTVHGINIPASSESVEDTEIIETETTVVSTTVTESVTTELTTNTSSERHNRKHRTTTSETEVTTKEGTDVQTETPEEVPDEIITEQTEPVYEEEEQQIEESTEAPDAPTLEEYLGKLKCGGCRHGCSLLNPRCMNGARKQSAAQSEYYSLYG